MNYGDATSLITAQSLVAADQLFNQTHDPLDHLVIVQNADGTYATQTMRNAQLMSASTIPWLTIIGVAAGAVALYLVWKNSQKTKKLDAMDYPDEDEDRTAPRLHNMSKALGHFRGQSFKGRSFKGRSGCAPRMAGAHGKRKYEFEPEIRLEGYKKRKAKR